MSAEAIAGTQEESQPEVEQYVPNLKCVACGKGIQLDVPDYAFYEGTVRCESCQAVMKVEIGDWFRSYAGAKYKTTVPVQELAGGRILSEPRLVSPGIAVPPSFLQVVHTDKIAQESQRHMKNALSHYADQTHRSSIVACRSAIQMALRDLGVQDRAISAMIEDAKERGIVDDFTQLCCKMIADAGGAAAHRAESPDGQREALTVIGLAVTVLGRLYAVPR